jgi:hypothetical protein
MKFEDLEFVPHPSWRGVQARTTFENGYGASVIKADQSYGGSKGFYELAVFGPDGHITYDTPITDDVLGWLTEEDVTKLLQDVENLPS